MLRSINYNYAYVLILCIYATGSAKTLHSRTSDFTTLTGYNFKSTNDINLKFSYVVEQ